MYGVVRYFDVFGTEHWTTFCHKLQAASGEFGSCETGKENVINYTRWVGCVPDAFA
jgi:hypothetical protein